VKTKNKILLTLFITIVLVFCSFLFLVQLNNNNLKNIINIEQDIHKKTINTITKLHSENLAKIVKDYGCYDQMIDFMKTHDTVWAKSDITIISSYEMDAVWVYDIKKEKLYTEYSDIIYSEPYAPNESLNKLFGEKTIHFFIRIPEGIMEISGGSINNTKDINRKGYAKGYLLIGKLWDKSFINILAEQTNSKLKIKYDNTLTEINSDPNKISLQLYSYNNKIIATLSSIKENLFLKSNKDFNIVIYFFFGIFSLLILLIFYFSFKKYVISPLGNIIISLKSSDASILENLKNKPDEFGNIAEIIIQFFEQKIQLENDLYERKIIEINLRESEKRFKDFAELLPGLVCEANIDGKLTFANHAAFEVFGWSPNELDNLSIYSIFAPEDVDNVKNNLVRRIQGENIGSNEYLALRKNGTTFPALVYVNIIYKEGKPESMRGVMVDITTIREAQKEIRKLLHAIEQSPNTIVITDINGNIEYVNPHFTQLTGYTKQETIGKNPNVLKSGKMAENIYTVLWETIKSGCTWKGEFINKKKNGELYWEYATISPVKDKKGNIINFIAVKEDITERKKLEQQLVENNEEIKSQNDELELQRNIATKQRDEIIEINNEIKSSIRYAENIQKAILTPKILLESLFEDYFVLYLPKDIVSGDFYWVKHVDNKTIVTVADCTGHGVPGAFMSILGVAFLNEIVNKKDVYFANEILNELREHVVTSLHQIGISGSSQDGMDMAIVIIDETENSLQYAGANNQCWVINEKSLIELCPDKMPVGIHEKMVPFRNNIIDIQKGDFIYLFTDGIADQFGGPQSEAGGKKFKLKQLKELLISISPLSLNKQKESIETVFNNWRNDIEQTDDVTIMGLKI
jgi:PAS domain S-box-containing protein